MIRGLYIASSGMMANERAQDVISNNIANANTVGYKSDTGVMRSFSEELIYRMGNEGGNPPATRQVGTISYGTVLEEVLPRFAQGGLTESDNPYAHAIVDGPVDPDNPYRRTYFPVQVGDRTMYTRDGDFRVQSGSDLLVTSSGDPVVPVDATTGEAVADARIKVVTTDGKHYDYEFVNADGTNYTGNATPQFGAVDILDSSKLKKYGDTYFSGGQEAPVNGGSKIVAGQLETSNVDLASSMVSMMNVMRSYEANQKMIKTLDGTLEKAVSIGRLG
ncbi:MAG TPA: flagellar hook-basal body complex protein [Bacilli bacterium]|nr:flagellar hook-basal body complex protein [Bacilli bacterium]